MSDTNKPISLRAKLSGIQGSLKAPKGQVNKFGGYNYRSAEDILNAVKPLLGEWGCSLIVTDDITEVAGRVYVKASATLLDNDSDQVLASHAFARETESKKGMDDAQVTGSASSYARKYSLNGLFCIDDTKDPDTMDNTHQGNSAKPKHKPNQLEDLI